MARPHANIQMGLGDHKRLATTRVATTMIRKDAAHRAAYWYCWGCYGVEVISLGCK